MSLVKRKQENNFPARAFRSAFDRVFSDFFDDDVFSLTSFNAEWYPQVDVKEDENQIKVTADLPGIDEKDLDVELKENILSIRGSREEKIEDKNERYHKIERRNGSFSRTIQLPGGVDADKITAHYEKGVLQLTIPKIESAKAKKIEVKSV